MLKKIINILMRLVLPLGCVVYAFWGIDFQQFGQALLQFGFVPVAVALFLSFVPYVPLGQRLNFLTSHKAGFMNSFKASIFCLGVNNIFPAKLGEVAKAFYLRKKKDISIGEGLGLIFWERLFDLNFLLLMALAAALVLGSNMTLVPLTSVVGGIWVCVLMFRMYPKTADFALKLVPGEKLRSVATEMMHQLQNKSGFGFFAGLTVYSTLFWIGNGIVTFSILYWVGGLQLEFFQALTVFVVCTVGFATPAAPGALGLVEAAFVYTLHDMFGVPKPEALAVALVFRFVTFVPTTLAALYVMVRSGMSIRGIKKAQEEEL